MQQDPQYDMVNRGGVGLPDKARAGFSLTRRWYRKRQGGHPVEVSHDQRAMALALGVLKPIRHHGQLARQSPAGGRSCSQGAHSAPGLQMYGEQQRLGGSAREKPELGTVTLSPSRAQGADVGQTFVRQPGPYDETHLLMTWSRGKADGRAGKKNAQQRGRFNLLDRYDIRGYPLCNPPHCREIGTAPCQFPRDIAGNLRPPVLAAGQTGLVQRVRRQQPLQVPARDHPCVGRLGASGPGREQQ